MYFFTLVSIRGVCWGLLHTTFSGEKLWLFYPQFSAYGKVSGKFMHYTRVQILPQFFLW